MSAEQGSAAWLYERCGFVTASRFRDVIGKGSKGAYLAGRATYMWEVVIERLTGQPADHFTSSAMLHGAETEPLARMAYEAHAGAFVDEVGFIKHPTIAMCGGSPDGTVEDDGGIEIKCPFNSAVHLQTILNGMPAEHMAQVQGVMWITDAEWCDFISFDPRMPDDLKLYVQRIERDDEFISLLEAEILVFDGEVTALVEKLRENRNA
jgi:hypothetical protein